MSVRNAEKFFKDNVKMHLNAQNDPALYNMNLGLLALVEALDDEVERLHREIAHVSQQVGQIPTR